MDALWLWLILAALLGTAELVAPGVFLVWVATAAGLTGVVAAATGLPPALQLVAFALLSVLACLAGRAWYKQAPVRSADPLLNDRGARLVGETATLVTAIVASEGRARLADSEWNVRGPDAPAGTRVRVLGLEDGALVVRPLDKA